MAISAGNKVKIITIGKVGPPGPASMYDILDISITSDGVGVKNIDHGFNVNLSYEKVSPGYYRIISSIPVLDATRISVVVINNNSFNSHILPNYMIVNNTTLDIQCLDFSAGGYTDSDLAIKIERLKQ